MEVDVERSDYERTPGRTINLRIGWFTFGVDTADGGRFGVSVKVGPWGIVVTFGSLGEDA